MHIGRHLDTVPPWQRLALALLTGSLVLTLVGCPPRLPLPPLTVNSTFGFGDALGTEPQALSYRWHYYAGNDVTSFRVNLDNTALPPQAHINLLDGQGQLVQRLAGAIGGWSVPIDGNKLLLHVWSQPTGAVPTVRINQMEYTRRHGPIFPEEPPPGGQNYVTARSLSHNIAMYGYLRGTDFTDYYVAPNLRTKPIDIVVTSLDNATLDVYTSYDGFLISPDRAVHHVVATNGNPAFIELDSAPRDTMYITVKSTGGSGRYYTMVNHVRHKLWVSYEFEGDDFWNRTAPNGQTYFDLVRALAVDASRQLYDSTDGLMRFDVVTIYKTERDFTSADVYIHDEDDYRANANSHDIDIARQHLENRNGWTVVHEWGHYEWGLPDEYEEIDETTTNFLCPNSMMSTKAAMDFCVDMNHDPTGELGGDSMWYEIWDQYPSDPRDPGRIPRKTETPAAERFPGLNLEPFIQWRVFE